MHNRVMETLNLKAIPICYKKNAYHCSVKEFNIIKNIKYNNKNTNYLLSESSYILQNKGLTNLRKFLVQQVEEYTRNVLEIKDQIYLTQSWSTLNKQNGSHGAHRHPNTFISVIYYVQCEKGLLVFDIRTSALQECFNFDYNIDKYNIYNSQSWNLEVKTGDIVLFPGHIWHKSLPNSSSTPKILIGANFFIKGILGSEENVSFLKI